jgi:hypothetical protein
MAKRDRYLKGSLQFCERRKGSRQGISDISSMDGRQALVFRGLGFSPVGEEGCRGGSALPGMVAWDPVMVLA